MIMGGGNGREPRPRLPCEAGFDPVAIVDIPTADENRRIQAVVAAVQGRDVRALRSPAVRRSPA